MLQIYVVFFNFFIREELAFLKNLTFAANINIMISLEGMKFYAFHGCTEEEKKVGIHFQVDVHIVCDVSLAAESDNINDALNYQTVYLLVAKEMKQTSNLIENVCLRIKQSIIQHFPQAEDVTVRISKMNPPLGGEVQKVSVLI